MQLKNKPVLWTKTGLIKLGKLIRQSREFQGISLAQAVTLIKERTGETVGLRTLSSVETSTVEPKYNTLAVIAAAGFVKHDGRVLDIFDFIAIASESFQRTMNYPLGQLIEACLQENGYSLKEFSELTEVSMSDLQVIMQGGITQNHRVNLRLICGHLRNPETKHKIGSLEELRDCCGLDENYQLSHLAKKR